MTDHLTRPIVGIENRSAQEVFDIMVDRIKLANPSPVQHVRGNRWRAFQDTTPGYWGIELEDAGNDDDAIMYPQKIHRDTVARIVDAHNSLLAQETVYKARSAGFSVLADNPTSSQNVDVIRTQAIEDLLSALTAHELYKYRPKAFEGFIQYARETLISDDEVQVWRNSQSPQPNVEWGDWTVDDTDTAHQIMNYLGYGADASREPGADRRRDKIAGMIRARIDAATAPAPEKHVVGDLDYCFDPENWEFTCSWPERDQVHGYGESLKPGQPMRVCTLLKGPDKWVADVPITWDEDGEPDETEIEWFDSEEEARAALATTEGKDNG